MLIVRSSIREQAEICVCICSQKKNTYKVRKMLFWWNICLTILAFTLTSKP